MGLRIEDVWHAYAGTAVVRGVSVVVRPGEVVCLFGPSGCGKTTLLRLAAGLEPLRRGRIMIGGQVMADAQAGLDAPPEHRRIGMMFQDFALFPHLSVAENVAFGVDREPDRDARVAAALARVGLSHLAGSYPHMLSGGQAQRCALARALAPQPLVLLLDEPFSGLDVALRAQVREETLALLRDSGVATLIVTHDPEEAMFLADRLCVMSEGSLLQVGTATEIYLDPVTPAVARLFGPVNDIRGRVEGGQVVTPLGTVPAHGLAEAAAARVLVRPEALCVTPLAAGEPPAGAAARVLDARLLGRCSHLSLALDGIAAPLRALVAGIFLPDPGTLLAARLDPDRSFVFPDAE